MVDHSHRDSTADGTWLRSQPWRYGRPQSGFAVGCIANRPVEWQRRKAKGEHTAPGRRAASRKTAAAWFNTVITTQGLRVSCSRGGLPLADFPSLQLAVLQLVMKGFSKLILIPGEDIVDNKPLATVGVDSMIAQVPPNYAFDPGPHSVPTYRASICLVQISR